MEEAGRVSGRGLLEPAASFFPYPYPSVFSLTWHRSPSTRRAVKSRGKMRYLASLSLSFLIYEMGIIIFPYMSTVRRE